MGMYPDFQGHRTRQFGRQIVSRLTHPFILVDTSWYPFYNATTVLPSFQWSLLRSNSGFLVVTGILRRGSTVNHLQFIFFGFMLVGLPLEASKNRVSTCFYMEYAQSSHPSTWSTNENKKVDESQVEEAVAYAKRPCLCLSPGGLRKCILSILINSTGLMVFLMGWHKSYPTSQYVYWKVLKVASSLGQLL